MSDLAIHNLMRKGKWEDAALACEAALQVQPTSARLWAYLGLCHFRRRDWRKAEDPFRKATVLQPTFWEAGAKLAQCLDRQCRYAEAYEVAFEFLRHNPNDRILQGLVNAHERFAHSNREEVWEQTRGLANDWVPSVSSEEK